MIIYNIALIFVLTHTASSSSRPQKIPKRDHLPWPLDHAPLRNDPSSWPVDHEPARRNPWAVGHGPVIDYHKSHSSSIFRPQQHHSDYDHYLPKHHPVPEIIYKKPLIEVKGPNVDDKRPDLPPVPTPDYVLRALPKLLIIMFVSQSTPTNPELIGPIPDLQITFS